MGQSMGHSEATKITVRGKDLCGDLLGKVSFTDMVFLELVGREPNRSEARLLDAVLVTLVEHGITANSLATRLTYHAAPSSVQGAMAAGLLGAGENLLGAIEQCAQALQNIAKHPPETNDNLVRQYVASILETKGKIPGLGHFLHKPTDPRTQRLFEIADEESLPSAHRDILCKLQKATQEASGKQLPINADGAVAAILSDIGFDWRICRGFSVIGRSAGLLGHIWDEIGDPISRVVWDASEVAVEYRDPFPEF